MASLKVTFIDGSQAVYPLGRTSTVKVEDQLPGSNYPLLTISEVKALGYTDADLDVILPPRPAAVNEGSE